VDKDRVRGGNLARKFGATWTRELDRIIDDADTEVVIHALPTPFRLEYVKRYIASEKHIFCEKPLARTLPDAEAILNATKGYKKTFMVGHVVRFFWEYTETRRLIKAGEIGKPGIARLSRCSGPPASLDKTDNWYADAKRSGGVILDLAIHDLDWLLWTFGPVKRVYAQTLANKGEKSDYALGILKFKNGMLAHIEGSWAEAPGSFWTAFEISGSGGLIEYDMRSVKPLTLTQKKASPKAEAGTIVPESPSFETPYVSQMKHFAKCIKSGKKPLSGAKEGFEAVRLALKLIESAQDGKPIEITGTRSRN